jgi:hypothetical protein
MKAFVTVILKGEGFNSTEAFYYFPGGTVMIGVIVWRLFMVGREGVMAR